jgi:hypothetical protein
MIISHGRWEYKKDSMLVQCRVRVDVLVGCTPLSGRVQRVTQTRLPI